ncbi:MAG: ATP-binding protein [Parcubacteria group bacterium]|nr:ATP-binding protein [Parcubacteria group bacterium]MCR4343058.1 ATP-binding protein [Patescibacteria group bacterium]
MFIQILRKAVVAFVSFLMPFLGFLILLNSPFSKEIFYSPVVRSIVVILICMMAFIVSYFAYQIYKKNHDARIFIITLAFYVFGFVFFLNILSTANFQFLIEDVFEVTEHYGLFLGSLFLLGFILPPVTLDAKIYQYRRKIFFWVFFGLPAIFIFLVFSPGVAETLEHNARFFIGATGVLLLGSLILLLYKYRDSTSNLIWNLIIGFSILINSAIIPFFYDYWNVLWWYFNFVIFVSFFVIFIGLVSNLFKQVPKGKEYKGSGFKIVFGEIPIYARISTKMILFIISISVLPLLATNYFIFNSAKNNLHQQVFDDLSFVSQSVKGQVFAYVESVESRTLDFSSDGFIRDKVKEITEEESIEAVSELNNHLIKNKKTLDDTILGIIITDHNGKVIASTDDKEIGADESNDNYFLKGTKGIYISELEINHGHFDKVSESLIVSAPLTDKETGELIGVIINIFDIEKIQHILSSNVGNNSGGNGIAGIERNNSEVYIVDRNKRMFVHPGGASHEAGDDHYSGMDIDTIPVNNCFEKGEDFTGIYNNYKDEEVVGVSICIADREWVVLIEKVREEVFQPLSNLENNLITIVPLTVIIILFFGLYFSGQLTEPIESLTAVSKRISDGDLEVRANIDAKDEIGILAENFNKMTDNLIEARTFPENIIRSMGDSLVVLSPDAKITKVNQATLDLLGYKAEELIGIQAEKVIGVEAAQAIFMGAGLKKLLEKGFIKDIEIPLKSKGGEDIPVSISASVIKSENDNISGIVVVSKDMRIFKEVEKAKSEFISIAAHQLRTPLSAIKWTMQMLMDGDFGKLNEEQKKALTEGNIANDRMVALIADLLNVSRIEEGRFALKFSPVKLDAMIEKIISSLSIKADKKGVHLDYIKTSDMPVINIDDEKIYIVLENLIENAIKYTGEGGKVIVETSVIEDDIEVKIKDTGIGIPDTEKDSMFKRFFRGSNARQKHTDGSGLGLYIAKNIVEKHNGRIWFESVLDEGATFFVRLPINNKSHL